MGDDGGHGRGGMLPTLKKAETKRMSELTIPPKDFPCPKDPKFNEVQHF